MVKSQSSTSEVFMVHETCLRCGRKLKTEASKELGFGKTCWEKYNSDVKFKPLFEMEAEHDKKND